MKYGKFISNPKYITQPHGYKTHLGIKRNGKFWKLACGRDVMNARGVSGNDFTYDESKVTCVRCQNANAPKEIKVKKLEKPVFWQKWTGGGGWEKASKSDVSYYLTKDEIKAVMAGKQIQNKNFIYAFGLEKPTN